MCLEHFVAQACSLHVEFTAGRYGQVCDKAHFSNRNSYVGQTLMLANSMLATVDMHFCLLFLLISHCLCLLLKSLYTTKQARTELLIPHLCPPLSPLRKLSSFCLVFSWSTVLLSCDILKIALELCCPVHTIESISGPFVGVLVSCIGILCCFSRLFDFNSQTSISFCHTQSHSIS